MRTDDVHLPGVLGADLGAVHLFPRARRGGLGVERAYPGVGLLERIGVDAGADPDTAVAAAARGSRRIARRPHPLTPSPFGRGGIRLKVILQTRDVAAAVAPELRF